MAEKKNASEAFLTEALRAAIRRALEALERFGHPHAVIGGVALLGYGRPRATTDADFLVFCSSRELDRLDLFARRSGLARDDLWLERNPGIRGLTVR